MAYHFEKVQSDRLNIYWFCDLSRSSEKSLFARWTYPFHLFVKQNLFKCDKIAFIIRIIFKYYMYWKNIWFFFQYYFHSRNFKVLRRLVHSYQFKYYDIFQQLDHERNNLQTSIRYFLYVNKIIISKLNINIFLNDQRIKQCLGVFKNCTSINNLLRNELNIGHKKYF